jgi:serine/threonine protein kinase
VAFCNQDDYIFERCGTPGYIAPEVFNYKKKNDAGNLGYDGKCDVFSAGCILFQILFGFRLFNGKDAANVLQLNKTFNYDQICEIIQAEINEGKSKINKIGLELLLKMLQADPKKRLSAFEALAHNYFTPLYENLPKSLGSRDLNLGSFRKSRHNVETSSLLSSNLQYSANQCLHTLSGDQSPPSFHLEEGRSLLVNGSPVAGSIEAETSALSSEFSNRVILPFSGSRVKKLAAKFPLNLQKNPKTSLFGQSKLGLSPPKSPFKAYSQAPSTGDISAEIIETESDDTSQIKNYVDTYKTPIFLKQSGKMLSLNKNIQRKDANAV